MSPKMAANTDRKVIRLGAISRAPVSFTGLEFDPPLYMRPLSVRERGQINARFVGEDKKNDPFEYSVALVAAALCDADGNRTHATPEMVDEIWETDQPIVEEMFRQVMALNKLGSVEQADAVKNSGPTPSDESSSG